ncbi:CDP-alcohol phosphatidyltransferase family protein [Agaribacter marinus]|uniref:Phosphatidylglycerophosphate synthase n=1 Tax=Agaribacter marinus TaxID=1431249 RepID=A0AA37WKC1_9ALTE|nr:CDP-alcohol phosphatidyltransferase family protein [Agaribacter marinus]GLR71314.1 hypothetical protein GCM10007852_22220 [Agaribacter marinus]
MTAFYKRYNQYIPLGLEKWSDFHAILLFFGTMLAMFFQSMGFFVTISGLSFSLLILSHINFLSSYRIFAGLANWLTLTRLLLVMFAILNFQSFSSNILFVTIAVSMALDVIDGFVARKLSTSSDFGRVFDMEADAFLVTALGLYFYLTTDLGVWLLLPGLMRYMYRLTLLVFPKPFYKECKKNYAAFLAGINFLILLIAIILPNPFKNLALAISASIVLISFSISYIEYFRHENKET